MPHGRGEGRHRRYGMSVALSLLTAATLSAECGGHGRPAAPSGATLRIGMGQTPGTSPVMGQRQLMQNLTQESLLRAGEDGRMQPGLAESWRSGSDGRSLVIKLRPNVTFHDGSPLDAAVVAGLLPELLRSSMGQIASDIDRITAVDRASIEISFKRPSSFLLEALEGSIYRGQFGTGPFVPSGATELKANPGYYLGRPGIEHITLTAYPNVRAAWADLLRDRLDMLYEVGSDALQSLEGSKSVKTFTFVRHYQYVIAFNSRSPKLKSASARRALNEAVDRATVIREGLNGQGIASSGLIWPQHWAYNRDIPTFQYDPRRAAAELASSRTANGLTFTCFVRPEATDERLALAVHQQLQAVGVAMNIEQASQERILQALKRREYDAVLFAPYSGPTIFHTYETWHSQGAINVTRIGNENLDRALDGVRSAGTDAEYKAAVSALQQQVQDDPPAIFLAWDQTTRAVSNRFVVATPEPGRDILSTLRLWKPSTDERHASRN
jgi:peptide/nickel transport system substrate-binding protein